MAKVYQQIASSFDAWARCVESGNDEWINNHAARINELIRDYLPHGSGFDSGITLDYDNSKPDKLIFPFEYHQMDEWGGYAGWYDYTLIVTPSLSLGYNMRITGRDYKGNKEYFYDVLGNCLDTEIEN